MTLLTPGESYGFFQRHVKKQKDRSSFGPSDLNMHPISKGKICCREIRELAQLHVGKARREGGKYYSKCNGHMPI